MLPDAINQDASAEEGDTNENEDADNHQRRKVTWRNVLTNRHFLFASLSFYFGFFGFIFFFGFFPSEIIDLGLVPSAVGFLYGSYNFVYLFLGLIYTKTFICIPRKVQFALIFLVLCVCHLCMGPSKMFNFPMDPKLMVSPFPFLGFAQLFCFLPALPEMLERV